MKSLKTMMSMILVVLMLTSLTACGQKKSEEQKPEEIEVEASEKENSQASAPEAPKEAASEAEDTEGSQTDTGSGKTLVVYYSATGNTEEVANAIAETTGGELFELEPVEPYTSGDLDWTDGDSRVTREHENPDQREVELVSATVDDWESVSVVYVGYPIWWGIAAWSVDSFVKANDFTGKTVVPFCTSSSSELGESGELLAEMAGTGDWMEGMRFSSSAPAEDVQAWVESLGL